MYEDTDITIASETVEAMRLINKIPRDKKILLDVFGGFFEGFILKTILENVHACIENNPHEDADSDLYLHITGKKTYGDEDILSSVLEDLGIENGPIYEDIEDRPIITNNEDGTLSILIKDYIIMCNKSTSWGLVIELFCDACLEFGF